MYNNTKIVYKKKKLHSILSRECIAKQNNALCFISGCCLPDKSAGEGLSGNIQNRLKNYGKFYYFLINTISPVWGSNKFRKKIKQLLNNYKEQNVIINLGSGPINYQGRKDIINIDIYAFDEVDIVCDAFDVPFNDNTVDLVINLAMLEHIANPKKIVSEIYRYLKYGGEIICYVPFMQPLHAAPHDYFRWTRKGAMELFKNFKDVHVGVGAGPTSGLLWIMQEWLSLLFSFGNSTLKDILFLIFMLITFPLKFIDILLENHPMADKIASGFYIHAKK